MAIYEEHPEPLYLIEGLVLSVAQDDESLLDLHVIDAFSAARRWFRAEADGRAFRPQLADPRATELFEGLRALGAFLLGGSSPMIESAEEARPEPISLDVLVECFRQLEKSAKLWSGQGGRRGYIEYIARFLPG
jgi:hypothetical protein